MSQQNCAKLCHGILRSVGSLPRAPTGTQGLKPLYPRLMLHEQMHSLFFKVCSHFSIIITASIQKHPEATRKQ